MEPNYTPTQPRERNRRADRYRQQQEELPQEQQPMQPATRPAQPVRPMPPARPASPVQVGYQRPSAPVQRSPYVPPRQQPSAPSSPYAPQRTPRVLRASEAPSVQTAQRRGAYRDHMLESPEPAVVSKPVRSDALPVWLVSSLLVTVLLALACFTGRILMDAYLYQRAEDRQLAHERVVEAHPLQYRDMIQRYAMEFNLQPAFVASIILNESSYNTHAESGIGARGLMQLMPDTASWIAHKLGLDATYNVEQLWTAETNIRFGCWYLNYLSKQFGGDAVTVASAYHAGQNEISSWLNNRTYSPDGRALQLSAMPEGPTKVYAGRVTRDYAIYDALYFNVFNAPVPEDDV